MCGCAHVEDAVNGCYVVLIEGAAYGAIEVVVLVCVRGQYASFAGVAVGDIVVYWCAVAVHVALHVDALACSEGYGICIDAQCLIE